MTWMDAPGFSSRNKGYNSVTLKSIIDKTELPVCIVEKKELPVCIVEKKELPVCIVEKKELPTICFIGC
jgi:hypothetical protein